MSTTLRLTEPRKGPGYSVFAVDPGETNGWSWACVGAKEIREKGVHDALRNAVRHHAGYLLGDSRWTAGQIVVPYRGGDVSHIGIDEWNAAELIFSQMLVCGEMGSRLSKGKVPQITDIVIEDFILQKRTMTRDLLSPVRITAAFQVLLCQEGFGGKVHLQSASDKSVIKDDLLRSLGVYTKGQQHARDASRHLVLWLRKNA